MMSRAQAKDKEENSSTHHENQNNHHDTAIATRIGSKQEEKTAVCQQQEQQKMSIANDNMEVSNVDDNNGVSSFVLWDLPEVLLYHIITFVAEPTHRASVICHQIAPLSKASYQTLLAEDIHTNGAGTDDDENDTTTSPQHPLIPKSSKVSRSNALWDALLKEDYGVVMEEDDDENEEYGDNDGAPPKRRQQKRRRACSRLKRTRLQRVRDAHALVIDNTELCYFYLCEMAHSASSKMSKSKFVGLLNEYGPHLRVNNRTRTGGTFLVEVCRAQHIRETIVLKCIQVLIEQYGANIHLSTRETKQSYMTPLCVASARGMPTVVQYLLSKQQEEEQHQPNSISTLPFTITTETSTARFRLFKHRRKTIRCTDATPLEFAQTIRAAELQHGATTRELKDLDKCIRLLVRCSTRKGGGSKKRDTCNDQGRLQK